MMVSSQDVDNDVNKHMDFFKAEGIKLNFEKIKSDLKEFGVEFDVFTSEQWIRDEGLVEKALADIKDHTYQHVITTFWNLTIYSTTLEVTAGNR